MKKTWIGLGMVVSMIFFCLPCVAQEKFPNKPIFINVGQGAGGVPILSPGDLNLFFIRS